MPLDNERYRMPPAYDRWREIMVNVTYNQQFTALLVIDPYNGFISESHEVGLSSAKSVGMPSRVAPMFEIVP